MLGLVHVQAPCEATGSRRAELGGAIGFMMSFPLLAFTSVPVAYVVLCAFFLVGVLITFELNIGESIRALSSAKEYEPEPKGKMTKKTAESMEDLVERGMRRADEEVSGKSRARKMTEEEAMNIVRPVFIKEY